ncbi:hypothetical protein D1818_23820 [Aquimarina sp. BL5]|uniref:hypothetical protein n=2 Tax=Aquimarina sp. BL5 TaxID=1714860 RepID=UPI000E47EA58|nr:hypothetical protein [Aquimarina sp. BL5]AXT53705.1 hypothetical protein D1818_23820 [Aquimarina sp. BL5]RKN06784.1 hypothetical protein D7036_08600 [Aquimarina sp. BL5]
MNFTIMRKVLLFLCVLVSGFSVFGQTTTFDNLNANPFTGKSISWTSSNYGSGFGHRIINSDPGGQTLLNFQGRHNSTSWSDILTLTSNGNVGIGTTSPTKKLDVNGSIAGQSFINVQKGGSYVISLNGNEHGYITGRNSSFENKFQIASNGNTYFNGGNVGIGTTNPDAKLQVEGQAKVGKWGVLTLDWTNETNWGGSSNKWAGYIGFNSSRNNEDPKDYYKGTNKYTSKGVFEGSNYGFRWLYRNHINYDSDTQHQLSEYMRLTNDGNLGIGTTNPDAKLAVNGNIHTKEVKVDLIGWADYVFKEDYNLPTLQQVEDHINQNGHLINIPSAAEVAENGIQLGEMNAKLLEKIEELTLYAISQEKQLKYFKSETKSSKEVIENLKLKNINLEDRLSKLEALLTTLER